MLEIKSDTDLFKVLGTKLGLSWDQAGTKLGLSWNQAGTKQALSWHQVETLLKFIETPRALNEIMNLMEWKNKSKFRERFITPILELDIIRMTIPDKPKSPNQQYYLSEIGTAFLSELYKQKF